MSGELRWLGKLEERADPALRRLIRETRRGRPVVRTPPAGEPRLRHFFALAVRGGEARAAVLDEDRRREIARLGGLAKARKRAAR